MGVSIVTLDPGAGVLPGRLVKDIGSLIEMLVILFRANEESAMKSNRLLAAWDNKRTRCGDQKLTSTAPKWLRLSEDRKQFELIEDRVQVVSGIFRMARDGKGSIAIAKTLNGEEVPTFGRADIWSRSYVRKILANRAVIGEFQPHRMQDGKRVPTGDPSLATFLPSSRNGISTRSTGPGRTSRNSQDATTTGL